MDPFFLEAYREQLAYMRELAGEFAKQHPKIGRRLGMQVEGDIGDPYVERLLESFSFVAARMQLQIESAFPQFTQPLLETVYPNYNAPTPSAAVARFYPGQFEGNADAGFRLARGATFISEPIPGEQSRCVFQSSQDVTLYPLELVGARLTGAPPDIPSLEQHFRHHGQIKGALRLKLRTTGPAIGNLRDLERLPVYLTGDERIASRLFELLHVASFATVIGVPERFGEAGASFRTVTHDAVVHEALEAGQGLLPLN